MSDCEMEYKPILVFDKVLKQGTYNGYEYYIISMGLHPCAYIVIPDQYQDKINPDDIICHYGISYNKNGLHKLVEDKMVIGWDYGHFSDWSGTLTDEMNKEMGMKKWTTNMIYSEVQEVIQQLPSHTEEEV